MTITPKPNLPPVVEFRQLKPFDRHEVKKLYARRVGVGFENTLDLVFDSDASAEAIVATKGESVIGFAVVLFLTAEGVETYFQGAKPNYPIGEINAVFHALAVSEKWERRGIGSELMRQRLCIAHSVSNINAAFANVWLRPHTVDASVLFEKYGFERLETVNEAFSSTPGKRECPDCEPNNCSCASAVYAKVFEKT